MSPQPAHTNQTIKEHTEEGLSNSEYSNYDHPNAAPSEITRMPGTGKPKKKEYGCFKRMFVTLDARFLKPLLVYKYTVEDIEAMDEIEAMMDENEG